MDDNFPLLNDEQMSNKVRVVRTNQIILDLTPPSRFPVAIFEIYKDSLLEM